MRKYTIALFTILTVLFLAACQNPFIVHNLDRPVYLTGIEIRSDILETEDPSHPLDQTFNGGITDYTVVVPYNATEVSVFGFPEEGAVLAEGPQVRSFDLGEQQLTFTVTVNKEHRLSSVYTVQVIRGLPEAVLAGIELYISDQIDPENLQDYEHDNYVINFAPTRDTYVVKVPAYTNHAALIIQSFAGQENKVSRLSYTFKNWEDKIIGEDGSTPDESYSRASDASKIFHAPLPDWYPQPVIEWGDLQFYGGGTAAAPTWFGANFVNPSDPDPRGPGKIAVIEITASAEKLNDKKYIIELQREEGAAYLDNIGIYRITGAGPGVNLPQTDGNGTPDVEPNRLIGNFARTNLNYDAALPDDSNAVRISPIPDSHVTSATTVKYKYTPYYFDAEGARYYINASGEHHIHPVQFGDPSENDSLPLTFPNQTGPIDFYFDVGIPAFQNYVRMEVVVKVEVTSGSFVSKTYRVMIRRQKERALLHDITLVPSSVDVPYPLDGNVFTPPVNSAFNDQVFFYTINVNAGRTHARIIMDNDNGSASGSLNRRIAVVSPSGTFSFRKTASGWLDDYNVPYGILPYADVELKSRNTMVQVQISDPPNFASNEYTLNILTRNSNDIILPVDAESDGQVRAVFADGLNIGLNAQHALPGELIKLSISANLGYYIDETKNDEGFVRGVRCIAKTIFMDTGIWQIDETGSPDRSKGRVYHFYMPDENAQFEVAYKPTTMSVNKIAYVAAEARRDGGYGDGSDSETGTSWGKASNDLQAVINSWDGENFYEIWVLNGTYTPPVADIANPSFTTPSAYDVPGYSFSGFSGGTGRQEEISFVLRPGIRIRGGFEETHNEPSNRGADAASNTILSGEYPDGTRAYHVILAVRASGALLETLTIAGGIGPETDTSPLFRVTPPEEDGVTPAPSGAQNIARNQGGGIYNVNSFLQLTNVRIRNNKSFLGGGMYTESHDENTISKLDNVVFFSNTALKSGGGMYNMASNGKNSSTITNSTFDRNKSVDLGGGLYNGSGEFSSEITNTVFTSNSAKTGGGIYTAGGESTFIDVTVSDNWTLENGSGIFNASEALFVNLDVTGNVALGGAGIGIYNAGIMRMTNAKLKNNSGSLGGGIYNAGTAVLSNVTIQENTTGRGGGGIENSGSLVLANCIIKDNTASSGGGLSNIVTENNTAHAVLVNVSITGNSATAGGGIYNYYEGSGGYSAPRNGFINVLLQNTLIADNTGGGIYNLYNFFSGQGINLTLNNTTIANNTGAGIISIKGGNGASLGTEDDTTAANQRAFPVYIRFRNSVVYQNGSGGASQWNWGGYTGFNLTNTPGDRETYDYSLLEDMDLSTSGGNLDGTSVSPDFVGGSNYRPGTGSSLINNASTAFYPSLLNPTLLLNELCWKTGGDGGLSSYMAFPVYISGNVETRSIVYFLGHDNSLNVGDLRDNGWEEGPDNKTRPDGSLAIGAYEQ
ncbi:hypothetical protein AGMMS50293_15870 [Spirochaetia bacterium]|nr:hypothetical protein AGMMS50293_15870 [Spirochaetia bacterium]